MTHLKSWRQEVCQLWPRWPQCTGMRKEKAKKHCLLTTARTTSSSANCPLYSFPFLTQSNIESKQSEDIEGGQAAKEGLFINCDNSAYRKWTQTSVTNMQQQQACMSDLQAHSGTHSTDTCCCYSIKCTSGMSGGLRKSRLQLKCAVWTCSLCLAI